MHMDEYAKSAFSFSLFFFPFLFLRDAAKDGKCVHTDEYADLSFSAIKTANQNKSKQIETN